MFGPESFFIKVIAAIKDFPAWLITAVPVAAGILLYVPLPSGPLPEALQTWLAPVFVFTSVLAVFKWISVFIDLGKAIRRAVKARKRIHITPRELRSHWGVARQPDGSDMTQISVELIVKNQTDSPIRLLDLRVIKPRMKGELIHNHIVVSGHGRGSRGGTFSSDNPIPAGVSSLAHVHFMVRGKPRWTAEEQDLNVVLAIVDEDGNEQRARLRCKGRVKPLPSATQVPARESLQGISDNIEKSVASVLQAEFGRYEKNGRSYGGLGSLHLKYRGSLKNQFGGDGAVMSVPNNQEIALDPEEAEFLSDNSDSLLALHSRLSDQDEQERFINALLSRLDSEKGYASVAYLIVWTLWKVGYLKEALEAALFGLPEQDGLEHGLGNVLLMLNGILRFRHPDFTDEMFDAIEEMLQGTTAHPFRILEKIAAIRAYRLKPGAV